MNPPLYLLLGIALATATGFAPEFFLQFPWPVRLFGVLPFVAGCVLVSAAIREHQTHETSIAHDIQSSHLLTSGPFRFSRNPGYTGGAFVLLAAALFVGDPVALVIVPLFMTIIYLQFIRREEALLYSLYGEAYAQYKKRTRRWL